MNNNINKAFETIFNDESLRKRFFEQKNPKELYEFCSSVYGGYTEEEFEEYIDNIMESFMHEDKEDLDLELNEHDLKNISGGAAKQVYNKFLASALASLALITPMTPASHAAGDTVEQRRGNIMRNAEVAPKKSFWQKYKSKIIGAGLFVAMLGGYVWWKKPWKSQNQLENPIENPVDNPAGRSGAERASSTGRRGNLSRRGRNRHVAPSPSEIANDKVNGWMGEVIKNNKALGLAILAPAAVGVFIEKIGDIAKSFNQTTGAYYTIQRMRESLESWIRYRENVRNNKPVELRQSIDNIDNLFAEIKGQEEAKREVRSLVFSILHKKKNAELSGRKYNKGDVLYFYGPSRVGKSLMAEGLARHKILSTSTEPYYISASEIDKDSNKETVLDQLFGMNSYGGYGYGGYGGYDDYGGGAGSVKKPKNLVKYIGENPNGIIIIDEYDKMWSPALDEVFRTIVDKGTVNVKGQTIDCSGMTFILTSNECTASIKGGNQYSGKDIDDGTGSRTYIKHDKSFLNRINPVEFKNLDAKSYEQIARTEMQTDLVDYWNNEEIAGLDVVITDEAYKGIAKSVERRNEGASHVKTLIDLLQMEVTDIVLKGELKQKDYYRGKKLFVDFDPNGDKFLIRDTPKGDIINKDNLLKSNEQKAYKLSTYINRQNNETSWESEYKGEKTRDGKFDDEEKESENDLSQKLVVKNNDEFKKKVETADDPQPQPIKNNIVVVPKKESAESTVKKSSNAPKKVRTVVKGTRTPSKRKK